MTMTHKQRIENALARKPVDRIPYSLWGHFPNRDRNPRRLAELCVTAQRKYDFDFIKLMPYGLYTTVDYGLDPKVFTGFEEPPVASEPLIKNIEDWDKLRPVSGTRGEYAVVLEAHRIFTEMLTEHVPFVQTVFSPLTTAAKLCSPSVLASHIKQDPTRVRRAVEIIADTTRQFLAASIEIGLDGLFYATQMSNQGTLEPSVHEEFVKKFDLELFDAVKGSTWFNILHVHGAKPFLKEMQDYPVQALSWHDKDDGPTMDEVRTFSSKAFIGGLSRGEAFDKKSDDAIEKDVADASACCGGTGVILAPGCTLSVTVPESRLELVHKAVLKTAK
ncbi:uroporphyrinogen decarboxylase [Synergistales bacterium]|nr:uroporphyrinogen decarboxylase [Synergistales bacterium]